MNQIIHTRQDCAVISAIFACKLRRNNISLLNTLLFSDAHWTEQMQRKMISRCCGSTNDHSLKFVQEVARFVTSRFFGKKSLWGSEKVLNLAQIWSYRLNIVAKLATLRTSLLLPSLSVWLQQHTHFHTRTGISGPRPIRGRVRPSLSLIVWTTIWA